jgi:beta-glucanase (GH16 family)
VLTKILKTVVCLLAMSTLTWASHGSNGVNNSANPNKGGGNSGGSCSAWSDTFSSGKLDGSRWVIASGGAPGTNATNTGYYETGNVQVSPGVLRIALTQVAGTASGTFLSYGGLVRTKQACGYGTYQWTMKMSSTALCAGSACTGQAVSGSVSAGFLYVNNSQTEIDFEFQAPAPTAVYLVNWLNLNPSVDPTESEETVDAYSSASPAFNPLDGQHTYKFVWTAGKISYYVDGTWVVDHTTNVPTAPAYFMINHWGTDNPNWGGPATTGVTRYMYVTQTSYSPSK